MSLHDTSDIGPTAPVDLDVIVQGNTATVNWGRVDRLAAEIQQRETTDDPRTRIGPEMRQPYRYWHKLAKAYLWMKDNGIKHWSERGRGCI